MARKTQVFDEYRVSERVVLRRGDQFRVKGGPYWRGDGNVKVSMTSKGPYTFHRFCKQGSYEWIEALDKNGAFSPLHVAGKRKRIDSRLVPRPYVVTSKKRTPRRLDD